MNRLITAKTYVIGAHRMIESHGLGHKKLIVQSIQNARHILKQLDQNHPIHQLDAALWELNAALDYLNDGNGKEAMKSLLFVERNILDPVLDSDVKGSVDRLIASVFPWRRI